MLKIWLLTRIDECHYDENSGFVVIADTSKNARKIVSNRSFGDENPNVWLDRELSKCELLGVANTKQKEGIVLTDFMAG